MITGIICFAPVARSGFVYRTAVRFVPPCFCFSVRIGEPYRIALGAPGEKLRTSGDGLQFDKKRLSFLWVR